MKFPVGIIAIIIGVVGLAVAASVYTFTQTSDPSPQGGTPSVSGEPTVTIMRTASGYEPKEVTVSKGDIVRFSNQSGEFHWPASDLHPTHGVYPEFDPMRPVADGEDWQFQFDQAGTWHYHDHIRANKTGTITVTE